MHHDLLVKAFLEMIWTLMGGDEAQATKSHSFLFYHCLSRFGRQSLKRYQTLQGREKFLKSQLLFA